MVFRPSTPSDDKSLLDHAIAEFLRAESAGNAGERQLWFERYPDCAAGLAEFFDDRDDVSPLIVPLRDGPVAGHSVHATNDLLAPRDSAATIDHTPEPPKLTSTRYRPVRFHARGGMGEIWLADDERIGRRVALKKLRASRDTEQARFFVEAQITGQLEHPSVVPLHDMGFDDAGQPYYIMKFIHGRRLREAIAQFHAQPTGSDWSEDVSFRKLLEVLVSVCNAVAYAHSKGVLHRDIKPDNVMLGSYGETLVVDWGLAKLMGEKEQRRESGVHLSGGESTATQDGAIVGSPYYMPPEGAEGRPDDIDQTSDVYLLGATLYEILTGRPPRHGSSNWELIDLARHSRPLNPRKVNPRVPRPLEAICSKAMAFSKEDRYKTPLDLAAEIERYLAGAPVSAYKEPLSVRAWRWVRRHRRAIATAACTVGVLLLGTVTFRSYREAQELSEREHARAQLAEFYRLADDAQYFAANTDPISERVPYYDPRRAEQIGQSALAIATPWGDGAARLSLIEQRADFLNTQYSLLMLLAQQKLSAENHAPDPSGALTLLEQARTLTTPSRSLYQLRSRALNLLGQNEAAKLDELRATHPETPVTAQDHFLQAELFRMQDSAQAASGLDGTLESSRQHLDGALDEYRAALQLEPRHYWARFQLGRCLLALGRGQESIEALSACIAIRPSSPWAYTTRGLANALSGRLEPATDDLNRAVAMQPDFQPARLNRGIVNYWLRNDRDAAMDDFSAVLAGPVDKRLAEASFYRGQALLHDGKLREALADFDSAIDTRPAFQPAYWNRAKTNYLLGDNRRGLTDVKEYLRLTPGRASNENATDARFALGKALRLMGQEMQAERRIDVLNRAATELQAAIDLGPPTSEMWQHLGAVQELLGQSDDSIDSFGKGLAISPADLKLRIARGWAHANRQEIDLAKADFDEALRAAPRDAEAHAGLGFVYAEQGRNEDAQHEAATALLADADNQLILHFVACIYARLSVAQPEKRIGQEDLAIAALERAITLSQRNPIGPDANEQLLISNEWSFPESLRSKPEFKRLLKAAPPEVRN